MNAEWDAWIPAGHTPARATVEAKLAAPAYTVEIACIAAEAEPQRTGRARRGPIPSSESARGPFEQVRTPSEAVDRLAQLYSEATQALRSAVERYPEGRRAAVDCDPLAVPLS